MLYDHISRNEPLNQGYPPPDVSLYVTTADIVELMAMRRTHVVIIKYPDHNVQDIPEAQPTTREAGTRRTMMLQVDEWSPELVDIEAKAKSTSLVLLILFEAWSTRAISCFVESAYMLGQRANLVIVLLDEEEKSGSPRDSRTPVIHGESISKTEHALLNNARDYLHDMAVCQACPIFYKLPEALEYVKQIVSEHRKESQELSAYLPKLSSIELHVVDRVRLVCDTYNSLKRLSKPGVITQELARSGLRRLNADFPCHTSNLTETLSSSQTIDFPHFCRLYVEYMRQHQLTLNTQNSLGKAKSTTKKGETVHRVVQLDDQIPPCNPQFDLYFAIPTHVPQRTDILSKWDSLQRVYVPNVVEDRSGRLFEAEWSARTHTRVLLYHVTSIVFGLTSMIDAAYSIGCGFNVALCVETLNHAIPKDRHTSGIRIKATHSLPSSCDNEVQPSSERLRLHFSTSPPTSQQPAVGKSIATTALPFHPFNYPTDSTLPSPMSTVGSLSPQSVFEDSGLGLSSSTLDSPDSPFPMDVGSDAMSNPCAGPLTPGLFISHATALDYNRGRTYLRSIAEEHHIPLSDNLSTTVDSCTQLLDMSHS